MTQFTCSQEIVTQARRALNQEVWDYLTGGAESEMTMRRNRHALDSYVFLPRVLRDVSHVDPSGAMLGHKVRIPVFLAPIGSLQAIEKGGGASSCRAASTFGTIPMISSITEPSLEECAAATTGPKMFQLYVRGDFDWIRSILGRVKAAGYDALAVTVDSSHYGIRERQLMNGYLPPSVKAQKDRHLQAAITWDLASRIRDEWGGAFILKGIAHVEDAAMAVARGVDAVYISNHGGRQLDHCAGALDTLAEIAAEVGKKVELIVDGGFLRGTDVIKAIALGASSVGIGRLQGWALAAGGEAALVRLLELLEREIINALGLLGLTSFAELGPNYVRKAEVIGPTHEFSTFYHLKSRPV
ncbi:alpha-hydroxy acid oxidase [Ancylobacter vacuolatus]|uniref:Glycolate oxidase n=1 Tax=Ancylobacter vacuolatus TaxID=223389 RepID=A0ABU0DE84_9HYPH|nr:alpha-hydroxy acid oxidase [Ancylobacter vacuolatus]MDQ0346728.1 glycolate oxidase [Ancylobacter vacuolatus]